MKCVKTPRPRPWAAVRLVPRRTGRGFTGRLHILAKAAVAVTAFAAIVLAGRTAGGQTGDQPPIPDASAKSRSSEAADWRKLQGDFGCMGTRFHLVLFAKPAQVKAGEAALEAAMDRIEQLNASMSDYLETSELSQLCRRAPLEDAMVGNDLWRVLLEAKRIASVSEGKFDPTIGPYSRLWRTARRTKEAPTEQQLRSASKAVGAQWLQVAADAPRVSLLQPEMRLDLGGIAKGFAADEALAVLRDRGFPSAFVEGGGDMALGAPPPGKKGWRVAVAALEPDKPPSRILELANAGLATSGDLWQFVELDGKRYSHLIDPRTGMGVTRRSSVTVVARNATLADAWASAGSVMTPADALSAWRRNRVDGLVLWLPDSAPDASGDPRPPAAAPQQDETAGMAQFAPRQHAANDGL